MAGTGRYTVLVFLLTAIQVHSRTEDSISQLLKLVSSNDKKPLVVYMDIDKKPSNHLGLFNKRLNSNGQESSDDGEEKKSNLNTLIGGDVDLLNDNDYGETSEENAKDQAKNLLYAFLRSSPNEDDSNLEDTKQVLRQALIARCGKVKKCVKKCKPKKPSCPKKCKEELDEDDLCDPPKCKKSKCGKTMPPNWMIRLGK